MKEQMKNNKEKGAMRRGLVIAIAVAALATFAVAALLVNIFTHQQEARQGFFRVAELTEDTEDPAVWGRNFPLQYDDYKKTVDQTRTRYGGSEAMVHPPSQADPRNQVAESKLKSQPWLKTIWAGYPFATDFREERGHAYMLEDQRFTRRVSEFKQPGACVNCHASTWVTMRKLGNGDVMKGFDEMNKKPYGEVTKAMNHPVSCLDCHDPQSMKLRITRPAFIEGIRNLKASQGVQNYDVNTQATAQEMRSYVCGQCHVEYYFKGPEKRLTFPWHKGLKVENAYDYYTEVGHKDFVHAMTGTPALKAQHPEFELYNQGVHARSGVACADCHMPYKREGGLKVSDHHVRSPLLNVNRACQGCHHFNEEEIRARAEEIQTRFIHKRDTAMLAVVDLISDLKAAKDKGATDDQLKEAREAQRRAQFYLDYVEAENSAGFHAPGEALRILVESVDAARKGQLALRDQGFGKGAPVTPPNTDAPKPATKSTALKPAPQPKAKLSASIR
jgi:nitrite reductase (cytochrome c-552)